MPPLENIEAIKKRLWSGAGRDEAKGRQKLIETGQVDVILAIRSNFFYTHAVPCELWFFDKARPKEGEIAV